MRTLALSERRAAYYQVLHEQPAFEAALRALFTKLFPGIARDAQEIADPLFRWFGPCCPREVLERRTASAPLG